MIRLILKWLFFTLVACGLVLILLFGTSMILTQAQKSVNGEVAEPYVPHSSIGDTTP